MSDLRFLYVMEAYILASQKDKLEIPRSALERLVKIARSSFEGNPPSSEDVEYNRLRGSEELPEWFG